MTSVSARCVGNCNDIWFCSRHDHTKHKQGRAYHKTGGWNCKVAPAWIQNVLINPINSPRDTYRDETPPCVVHAFGGLWRQRDVWAVVGRSGRPFVWLHGLATDRNIQWVGRVVGSTDRAHFDLLSVPGLIRFCFCTASVVVPARRLNPACGGHQISISQGGVTAAWSTYQERVCVRSSLTRADQDRFLRIDGFERSENLSESADKALSGGTHSAPRNPNRDLETTPKNMKSPAVNGAFRENDVSCSVRAAKGEPHLGAEILHVKAQQEAYGLIASRFACLKGSSSLPRTEK